MCSSLAKVNSVPVSIGCNNNECVSSSGMFFASDSVSTNTSRKDETIGCFRKEGEEADNVDGNGGDSDFEDDGDFIMNKHINNFLERMY